ncbi:MAG: zinc-ribbon domain-containing protein [Nitrososphaerota archaeon]|nr:zinc-ribbon domain-containing protein [Nitrososphaerota archaeon]
MMRCPYCGRNLNDGARFCSGCGKPLQQEMQTSSARSQLQLQQSPAFSMQAGATASTGNGRKTKSEGQSYWEPTKVRWFIVLITTGVVTFLSLLTMLVSSDAIRRISTFPVDTTLVAANELSDVRFVMFGALVLLGLTIALSVAGFRDGSNTRNRTF